MSRFNALAALLSLAACHEQAQTHLARGNVLANQGKIDQAITEYQAAAAEDSKLSTPWLRLGNLYYEQGKRAPAEDAYEQATKRNPGQVEAWVGLARAQSEDGQNAEARASLGHALDAQPKDLYARLSRAQLALDDGDAAAALADAKVASAIGDRDPSVLYVYGSAMLAAKDLAGAAAAFDRIAQVAPDSSLAAYGHARLAAAEGKRDDALAALRTVVAKAPDQKAAIARDPAFAALRGDPAFRDVAGATGG